MGGVVHTTLATTRSTGVVDPAQSNPFDDDKMYEPPGRGRVHGRHGVVGLAPSRRAVSHRTAPTLRQTLGWVASTTTTTLTEAVVVHQKIREPLRFVAAGPLA